MASVLSDAAYAEQVTRPAIPPFPARSEVRAQLAALVEGRLSREQVSSWASPWVWARQDECEDQGVWEALEAMAGADSLTTDRPYLFGTVDFQAWLDDLDAPAPPPR